VNSEKIMHRMSMDKLLQGRIREGEKAVWGM
jgi:hypothetical protein